MGSPRYTPHRKLKALRVKRGETRYEFAERVGVSYQHVYGMETGWTKVKDETLARIANVLGVPLEDIQETDEPSDSDAPGATSAAAGAPEMRRAS
jgi:transcriptional regulator with XRE-family HTH domain